MSTTTSNEKLDFDKVWLMFQDVAERFKETDKKFKATDEKFQETDKLVEKTTKSIEKLSKRMSEQESRWGKFVEALVEGALVQSLNKANIPVNRTLVREKKLFENKQYEIDIIAKNGKEIVAVEVKTTLKVDDVNHFIEKLKIFKDAFPDYKSNVLYGAVAYIHVDARAHTYAAKKGLIVIKAVGESAQIANEKDFIPRKW